MKTLPKRALLICMCLVNRIAFLTAGPPVIEGLTMDDAIHMATANSVQSMTYRYGYAAAFWEYRSYRASVRPFLTLSSELGGLNRSMSILQDYNTGNMAYRTNWSLTNEAVLSLQQAVPLTGGMVSVSAHISRLDQYLPNRSLTYYTQPLFLNYSQSIGGFNSYKWNRRIMPQQYEMSRREYLEQMERLKSSVIVSYWNYVSLMDSYERCLRDYEESRRLYALSRRRYLLGMVDRMSLQQLELKLVEDSMDVCTRRLRVQMAHDDLCSNMGILDDTELELTPEFQVPQVQVSPDDVLERAFQNSSYNISRDIQSIQAQQNIDRAKASSGFQSSVNVRIGLSGTDNSLASALGRLQDQEIASVSISVPIVDWGEGRSHVRQAKAQASMVNSSLEQQLIDYKREIWQQVMEFNNMGTVCRLSERAFQLAQENYSDALEQFSMGKLTVTELNQIRSTRDNARMTYIGNISGFWQQYYQIRSITHWDYIENQPIADDVSSLEMELIQN